MIAQVHSIESHRFNAAALAATRAYRLDRTGPFETVIRQCDAWAHRLSIRTDIGVPENRSSRKPRAKMLREELLGRWRVRLEKNRGWVFEHRLVSGPKFEFHHRHLLQASQNR